MLATAVFLTIFISGTIAGSLCPPRENIYPCVCTNVPLGRKQYSTIVHCHHLWGSDSLKRIFPSLRAMQIDSFFLYDSFWEADKLGKEGENQKVLPDDWLTLLKVKEIEIVDTPLSSCFACSPTVKCKNSLLSRFALVNSSSHEKICTSCDTGKGYTYSWTGCMTRLREFHFSNGKLSTLDANFFAVEMKELTTLNLTYNEIAIVDPHATKNLPRLKILDLSHNVIEYLADMFNTRMNLEYLDVSSNLIETLGDSFFTFLPYIKTFKADNNQIRDMEESEWKDAPSSLKNIDLSENPLHCDCNIQWINNTFHVNVVMLGQCYTPEEYENTLIRKASRYLNERCIGSSIGTRYRPRSTTPMILLL